MENTVIVFYSRTGTTRRGRAAGGHNSAPRSMRCVTCAAAPALAGDVRCVVDNLLQRHVAYAYDGRPLAAYDRGAAHADLDRPAGRADAQFPRRPGRVQGRLAVVCLMASRGAFNAIEEVARLSGKVPQPVLALLQRRADGRGARDAGWLRRPDRGRRAGGRRRTARTPHEA